ncbi:MAG: hypothetical protein KGI69_03260 [Patescibacteria group bacterium]|nr:hypothetical protein [Patescibacteria group bacterium]
MRRIYITFSGSVYDKTTKLIVRDGPRLGADEVWVYDDVWLTMQEFYSHNHWLWEHHHKRGFGWYAWKPFIILDALSRLEEGDIVLYTDADTYPIRDLSALYDRCARDGIMLFESSGEPHVKWCKRDCYIVMGQDEEKYHGGQHGVARFMAFQKGRWRPYQFLMEWLAYCVNPLATTFDPSVLGKPELPGFVEHRTEQAIMTNLAHKYGYRLHREADQAGEGRTNDRDLYDQLFIQKDDWVKKTGRNMTAPVEGSAYRNIPGFKAEGNASQKDVASGRRRDLGSRLIAIRNIAIVKTRRTLMKAAFRITPRPVKTFIKRRMGRLKRSV